MLDHNPLNLEVSAVGSSRFNSNWALAIRPLGTSFFVWLRSPGGGPALPPRTATSSCWCAYNYLQITCWTRWRQRCYVISRRWIDLINNRKCSFTRACAIRSWLSKTRCYLFRQRYRLAHEDNNTKWNSLGIWNQCIYGPVLKLATERIVELLIEVHFKYRGQIGIFLFLVVVGGCWLVFDGR